MVSGTGIELEANWRREQGAQRRAGVASRNAELVEASRAQPKDLELRWCPGRESNPHGAFAPRDFKSRASASFATRAESLKSFYRKYLIAESATSFSVQERHPASSALRNHSP